MLLYDAINRSPTLEATLLAHNKSFLNALLLKLNYITLKPDKLLGTLLCQHVGQGLTVKLQYSFKKPSHLWGITLLKLPPITGFWALLLGKKANLIYNHAKNSISNSHSKPIYEDLTDEELTVDSPPTTCYDSTVNGVPNDIF